MILFGNVYEYAAVTLLALLLDRAIGDPPSWPHPVRLIGALLNVAEPYARRWITSPFYAGVAAALFVLLAAAGVVTALLSLSGTARPAVSAYLAFSGLALGQLIKEGRAAFALLKANDIPAARIAVGYLVSRDVSNAGCEELSRTLAETLAENLNDAFVAPLFWFAIGGPLGLWLYKTASTMDSLWGYPHEPWTKFGSFAARLDDVLAFIPARITVFLLAMRTDIVFSRGSKPGRRLPWPGFAIIRNDAKKMKSPNAGWPMAAAAWIFEGTMGGKAVYAGGIMEKPVLGPPGKPWTAEKLTDLIGTLSVAGYSWGAIVLVCGCIIRWG